MENFRQDNTIFKLGVDESTRQNLKGLAQWAKINAIVGFASIGVSLVSIIITASMLSDAYSGGVSAGKMVGQQIIVWLISIALNVILLFAAGNIQKALVNTDQRIFNLGLSQLARYFKIIGIIFIVAIAIILLVFVIGLFAAAI